ncbi:uncharacterized protein LACBIDRAFT_305279 [Laccaria bicolor S238N-H82]|uniref:Predicted protein n=1 Tax=Laccaria bicolor (strain S238N-H82 / ATCC MYA-4686) TaxID=486041 RepID=B0CTV4_LACBS|nr:uncharacterized protein LACBIDRAFT_305279 [Laccaria bicolor S238N-H82]EDR14564.1 predicted protein [Laccaria bicolor S238N-H82]|eukprot:XP_001875123.1 predicted protein [Laccaria bicolor S238N-H82]
MVLQRRKTARARMQRPDIKFEPEESEEEEGSEDEYVAEDSQTTGRFGHANKRRKHQDSHSDSDVAASDNEGTTKRHSISNVPLSPGPTPQVQRKRKTTNASDVTPASKRKKAAEVEAVDDPIRKYCLGKLEELFRDIFLRYPHVHVKIEEGGQGQKSVIIPKPLEELSDEDKDALIEESKQFAEGLERCVFEIYSEPDRNGNSQAGGNYKDRFRMLQFNLSKPDRVIIHQRITSANISPKEISLMSSTDLADEETKQSIKIAEKEALAYSILQKATAPRAKITHKGLQDIEDINGQTTTTRELDRQVERDLEGEERRERERTARLKVQRQRTDSVSVPPESPTVSQTPSESWGAPPPIPPHAVSTNAGEMASPISRPPVNPLFIHTASELALPAPEPELNLADLINIDDEPTEQESLLPSSSSSLPSMVVDEPMSTEPVALEPPSPSLPLPTGISPFAARAEKSRAMSFDLNALWNAPKSEDASKTATPRSPPLTTTPPLSITNGDQKDIPMELESEADDEAKDQDFDMFLEDREVEKIEPVNAADVLQAAFDALPHVWTGQISMPLDSTIPQETAIIARQVGGKPLAANSPLWKTLFPSSNLRIDGRVPVEGSAKYLLQMRMNAAKELFSVAFTPSSDASETGFKALSDFLTAKSRHGLIFPWGSRPKEHHPGRELYIIPLPATQPLPDYIELLDNLKLPPVRKADYLVGIWILNKGKLAPPPPSPPPPPVTVPALPAHLSIPSFNAAIVPPATASTPPIPHPPPILSNLPPIAPAALAAEVASLTPEQIQNVLKALASATPLLPTAPPAQVPQQFRPPPQNPPPPPVQHARLQMPPSHAQPQLPPPQVPQRYPPPPPTTQHQQPTWPPPPAPYPSNYPPMQQPNMPPYRGPPQPPPPSVYDRPDYGRDPRADVVYERERGGGDRGDRPQHDRGGSRGWRGGGRGRGKGWESPPRPIDSGWPRRGRGGGPASNSPPRRW